MNIYLLLISFVFLIVLTENSLTKVSRELFVTLLARTDKLGLNLDNKDDLYNI